MTRPLAAGRSQPPVPGFAFSSWTGFGSAFGRAPSTGIACTATATTARKIVASRIRAVTAGQGSRWPPRLYSRPSPRREERNREADLGDGQRQAPGGRGRAEAASRLLPARAAAADR